MEFYQDYFNMTANVTNTKIILVDTLNNDVLNFMISLVILIWFIQFMFGWCQDPLAVKLQEKLKKMEDENEDLLGQIYNLTEDLEENNKRVAQVNEKFVKLCKILEKNYDDSDSDSQKSAVKRRRMA